MVIVCGVDDSARTLQAAQAAAALARRADEALVLLHAQEAFLLNMDVEPDGAPVFPITSPALLEEQRKHMQASLEPLRRRLELDFGIPVELRFALGFPARELVRCALDTRAVLIVVGAVGRRPGSTWRLGSVPDGLSRSSPVPLLVVRDAAGFSRWALAGQPLRVVVSLGRGRSSTRAAELADGLARLGPCELAAVRVYDPERAAARLGLAGPELERALTRELAERSGRALAGRARFVALRADGTVAETLAAFAAKEQADLVVTGTRAQGGLERRIHRSVAHPLLGRCRSSVLLARGPSGERSEPPPREPCVMRRVLAATDFSAGGDRAVAHAVALLPPGGRLTLLHVIAPQQPPGMHQNDDASLAGSEQGRLDRALAQARLRRLIPADLQDRQIEAEVVESSDVTRAILQAAERLDADLVVLGRSGRRTVAAALAGSSARDLARKSPRPVLLVPEAAEGG